MQEREIETAEMLTNQLQEAGRAKVAKLAFPDQDLSPDQYKTLECSHCGEDLPEFRLKKGMEYCVECQGLRERQKRR